MLPQNVRGRAECARVSMQSSVCAGDCPRLAFVAGIARE